ncbi:MAG: efflux RND transporter permease subunit [Gammaproteobacteria bacterium]|jgi:multidrug efflux pump subunit AcrB|nr:efflux RND transporter permease subunit [Gammaproteobacteria bacterium]
MFEKIINRGTLMTVIVGIVVVLGIVATLQVPVQMIPDLDVRTVQVRTSWPGATPQDIEKEILIEQEEYLRSIPSLQRIEATASAGSARIELEFPHGVDINETLIRVNNALSQVPSYPNNVNQPRIFAESFSSNSFMYFRVAPLDGNPRGLDMDMMRDFVSDNVRTRMETVPGVSSVEVWGGADRQVQILLNAAALAERGLTVADVRTALRSRNLDVTGGQLESGKRRYLLRTIGRFNDLESLGQLILARNGDQLTRLDDVASVRLDHFEIEREAFVNGKPVLFLAVNRELGSNVIKIKDAMFAEVERINQDLLQQAGMELKLNATDTVYVEQSIATVWRNLALGAVLATLVMFLFLRSARMTLVGVIGIPICTIAAFLGLLLAGRTINVISLAGVAFSIGMTLDNTIVVLESIEWERRRGLKRLQAAIVGVQRVWPAVLASTLTTVLVFIPIIFIEEEAGQLYGDIAIGVSATILVSMLVAITVVPTAAANFALLPSNGAGSDAATSPRVGMQGLLRGIDWLTGSALRRVVVMALTLLLCAATILELTPPAEYLPPGEEPKVFGRMNAPPGYNLPTMREIGYDVQEYFLPYLDDEPGQFERGETAVPALDYLIISIRASGLFLISEPRDKGQVDALMDAIDAKYSEYAGMRSFTTRGSIISSNDGGTRSINLDISGPELEPIYSAATAAYNRAREVFANPRIRANPATLSLSQPLIEIHPDWERAAELGMNTSDIGFTVAALTDGTFVDEFFLADDKIDMYVYSAAGPDASPHDLSDMPIYTRAGGVVPLSSIARAVETVDTNTVRRIDGRRTVTLNIIPPADVALESGVEIVREDVLAYLRNNGAIPANVSIDISGASDQLEATQKALLGNYLVALILVYLVMVAIFTHWGYPLLIMTTIPLGVAGGIAGLALMNWVGAALPSFGMAAVHQPFDMISMLGFLILMGTVVNNPILIVHRAAENYRRLAMSATEAVNEAVESRLRPIAMSAITTIFGLAPLVFIPGEGTELYRGVGAIVLFGLAGAAIVTLTFLPAATVTVLTWTKRHPGDAEQGSPQTGEIGDVQASSSPA